MANRVQPAVLVLGLAKSGYAAATALLAGSAGYSNRFTN